jgi:hypothetical protein
MIERQLLWYMYSGNNPERHHWNVFLVNEPGEIDLIRQKLRIQLNPLVEGTTVSLNPIVEESTIDKGKTRDPGLHYELFHLETTVSAVDFSKIYQGKVAWDRRLRPRKTARGWFDFADKAYNGEI